MYTEPVPAGSPRPMALFQEMGAAAAGAAARRWRIARAYARYYCKSLLDALPRRRAPFRARGAL